MFTLVIYFPLRIVLLPLCHRGNKEKVRLQQLRLENNAETCKSVYLMPYFSFCWAFRKQLCFQNQSPDKLGPRWKSKLTYEI